MKRQENNMKLWITICLSLFCTVASADNRQLNLQQRMNEAKRQVTSSGPGFELVGILEKGRHTSYAINGEDFIINKKTQIEGSLKIGATADASGKIEGGNSKVADTVVIADPHQDTTSPEPIQMHLR